MPDFDGSVNVLTPLAAPPAPIPQSGGRTVIGARRVTGEPALTTADILGAAFDSSGGVTPPQPSPTDVVGLVSDLTPGVTWFDRVHALPRSVLNFGNLITTAELEFELFNAFGTETTLTTFLNNAGAGVSIPELPSLPSVLGPFASLLDPNDSSRLNPDRMEVRADPDGPATFANTLDFTFAPGGTVSIAVAGERIAFIPVEYEDAFVETLEFRTDVLRRQDGTEQRIAARAHPRQRFNLTFRADELDRRLLDLLLFEWQSRVFALPLFHEFMELAVAVTGGASATITVDTTDFRDLRVGGLAAVFLDNRTFDILTVQSFTPTSITFTSAVQNSYAVGDLVMPVRTATVAATVRSPRFQSQLRDYTFDFTVTDNSTGALTGDVTPFSSYAGRVLLDDCNLLDQGGGQLNDSYVQRLVVIDNEVGVVTQVGAWDTNRHVSMKGFLMKTFEQIHQVRRLLIALRGQQVSFWLPTFDDDIVITQAITSGTDQMVIENIDYTRFAQNREPRRTVRLTFTDGTTEINEIQSSVETSDTEETLTMVSNWTQTRTPAEIVRTEFVEGTRFATDEFRFQHRMTGRARLRARTTVVF